jgi:1-deoxy-D-xylulose-5-phosphate reductoisomerase
VLNAANEVAVGAFLDRQIAFPQIASLNAAVLEAHLAERAGQRVDGLDEVIAADAWARDVAHEWLSKPLEGQIDAASASRRTSAGRGGA